MEQETLIPKITYVYKYYIPSTILSHEFGTLKEALEKAFEDISDGSRTRPQSIYEKKSKLIRLNIDQIFQLYENREPVRNILLKIKVTCDTSTFIVYRILAIPKNKIINKMIQGNLNEHEKLVSYVSCEKLFDLASRL